MAALKKQVQEMVRIILNLEKIPKPDDVADALAITICHAHSYKLNKLIFRRINFVCFHKGHYRMQ